MNMVFQAGFLAFALLISATVAAEGDVSIWMDSVKLTCPSGGVWFQKKGSSVINVGQNGSTTYEYKFDGSKDQYHCIYSDTNEKYHFYIQGKACEGCLELDAWVFAVVIAADVMGTAVIMAVIYKCCKGTSGGPQKTSNARSRSTDIPLDPYEPLNVHTRSADVYNVINRTG